jgi:hypothetical protein
MPVIANHSLVIVYTQEVRKLVSSSQNPILKVSHLLCPQAVCKLVPLLQKLMLTIFCLLLPIESE